MDKPIDAKPMLEELSIQARLMGDRAAEMAAIIAMQRTRIAELEKELQDRKNGDEAT